MRYTGKESQQGFFRALFTQKCKHDLRVAAAKNKATIHDALDLFRNNPDKIVSVMKQDRRRVSRH